jgi:regulator of RNase E activity RraB
MNDDFPNDAQGDALRRLVASGNNLSKPMFIDFHVAAPDETAASGIAEVANKLGYRVTIYATPTCALPWTCQCSTRMLVTYASLDAIEAELAALAMPFGGRADGWGSFGNGTG